MIGKKHLSLGFVLAAFLAGTIACGGDDNDPNDGSGGTGPGGTGGGQGGTGGDGGTGGTIPIPDGECGEAVNLARRDALLAAQPAIGVRSKAVIGATIRFASLAGNPSEMCEVDLEFRDANGNGVLDPYENWTLSAEERVADLLGRMDAAQKAALLAHPALGDRPTASSQDLTDATRQLVNAGVRFGRTAANNSTPTQRATWANNVQALAEQSDLGIPFVISSEPAHSRGSGRVPSRGFSVWPHELGLGAGRSAAVVENYGKVVSEEFRAIGVRMVMSPSADLATDPRRFESQFSFGEDSATVAELVAAYVKGAQGDTIGAESIAAVVGSFPGGGAVKTGRDGRLANGKFLSFSGTSLDAHVHAFTRALDGGLAGVMAAPGVLEQGSWTALGGLVDGNSIEQVGVSFNEKLVNGVLRERLGFGGLVLSGWNVLENAGGASLGAPWGVETLDKQGRAAKAIAAGVDQFGGLADPAVVAGAHAAGLVSDAQLEGAAGRALALAVRLGLFENPYVDPERAPARTNTDAAKRAGWAAQADAAVLVHNVQKPAGWLNGAGNGSQSADKGNAGNGTGLVLPAPPGEPYVAAGCAYFVMGDFDLDYVRSVSAGYGELTNDSSSIGGVSTPTEAQRIARSDYVFIRIAAPCSVDSESGALGHCTPSLEYGAGSADLADLAFARQAIDSVPGSRAQIIVIVDGGRPSVVSEIMSYGVSGLYQTWSVSDKVMLDVAFGIVDGRARLPVGLPLSDTAASQQRPDLPGDGQHPTFIRNFGLDTNTF